MSISFTQYLLPNGRTRTIEIDRPPQIEEVAHALQAKGFRFEIEMLQTGDISMSIEDDDGPIAIRVCNNGPEVPISIDSMIQEALRK